MAGRKKTPKAAQTSVEAEITQMLAEDGIEVTEQPAEAEQPATVEVVRSPRVFVVGPNKIVENDSTVGMTNEQVRDFLRGMYPEVANATIRERDENGTQVVEFLPQPGRKG